MRRRLVVTFAFVVAAARPTREAKAQGSTYVPLDDPAYGYVDALLARGALHMLPALERPYLASRLREALTASDTISLGRVERGWVRALDVAIRRWELDGGDVPTSRLTPFLLGTAESSGRRELMQADGWKGASPGAGARFALAAGPLVAAGRLQLDNRLEHDPEFAGSKKRAVTGRVEDAYIAGQWRWASAFVGRTARNLGPWTHPGLQIGGYAYSWDHLQARLGGDRIALSSMVARLEPYRSGGATDTLWYERHFAMHRLSGRWRDVDLAASEAVVYGGIGRGTELAYANPLTLYQLAQYNETRDGNVNYALDVAWRPGRRGAYAAQLLVDDFQIDRCSPACAEPASWGLTLSAEGVPLTGAHRLFGSYTRLSNLTYNTNVAFERWTTFGTSLGRPFSDYDEWRTGVDVALLAQLPVRAYVAGRRQGEGGYRAPFPSTVEMPTVPAFLAGTVERTVRAGVSGAGVIHRRIGVSADLGWNAVRDADHVQGRRRDGFEGRVRASIDVGALTIR